MKRCFRGWRLVVLFVPVASVTLPLLLDGCSEAAVVSPPDGAVGLQPDAPGEDAGYEAAVDARRPPELSLMVSFDPGAGEFPEGITIIDGNLYVGFARGSRVIKFAPLPDGGLVRSNVATLPRSTTSANILGLIGDGPGNLYIARTNLYPYNDDAGPDAAIVPAGVYRVASGADGGLVTTPWSTDALSRVPNGFTFDRSGNLFVTDSLSAAIMKIAPDGTSSVWIKHAELESDDVCPTPTIFPFGANGISFTPTAFYVTNTRKGSLVRIAINDAGQPGAVSTVVKDCTYVGLDGLALDSDGTLLATSELPYPGKLLRITTSGDVTELTASAPLDSPASVVISTNWAGTGDKYAFVTNSSFYGAGQDGGRRPGIVKYGPLP